MCRGGAFVLGRECGLEVGRLVATVACGAVVLGCAWTIAEGDNKQAVVKRPAQKDDVGRRDGVPCKIFSLFFGSDNMAGSPLFWVEVLGLERLG